MKIAVVGPAGAGKSTIARAFVTSEMYSDFELIEVDAIVKNLYAVDKDVQQILVVFCKYLPKDEWFIVNGRYDYKKLGQFLASHTPQRTALEDHLYYKHCLPILQKDTNVVIDGLLPRFVKMYPFDQVITITAPEHIRRTNLEKRGVAQERIEQIINLQKNMF